MTDLLNDLLDTFGIGPCIAAALLLCYMAVAAFVIADTSRRCLDLGWRASGVTWTLDRYCATREEQTDVVVPLREAKRR